MVSLPQARFSNARIANELPANLVAVFVGGTRGIGETTLKQLAKQAVKPRIYFIGRSEASGSRVTADLQALNPAGEYHFISADVSLLRSVDQVCRAIKAKERLINLLFMTSGTMTVGKDTDEGLYYPTAVTYYARIRFVVNLLPLLQRATHLRRVVTVFCGTKEGVIDTTDFQGRHVPMMQARGHMASMMTLALESLALEAPDVSYMHVFPGSVKTDLGKDAKSATVAILRAVFTVIGPLVNIPFDEAGERQLFLATSARFPARFRQNAVPTAGVPLSHDITVASGIDACEASGVYSVNYDGETAPSKVEELLQDMRDKDVVRKLWLHTEDEFTRVTGTAFTT
ncbi:hypothetical protein B0H63DRAFT_492371 [Podospora didyma]|uniref:Uncharacterized protein n=1 Tax=Podospora didyma TaxID=330526 RepID=A0AAE0NX94_9PEZI|nr:hypothetical protein B0H63DRAFT_492371 [Podospora didyma]